MTSTAAMHIQGVRGREVVGEKTVVGQEGEERIQW